MRKIYMIDLGLLVAAGTIAAVLTAKPVSSQVSDNQYNAVATAVSGVSGTLSKARALFDERAANDSSDSEVQ